METQQPPQRNAERGGKGSVGRKAGKTAVMRFRRLLERAFLEATETFGRPLILSGCLAQVLKRTDLAANASGA